MRALSTLTVRPAGEADATRIGQIYVDAWLDTYPGLLPGALLRRLDPEATARRMRRIITGGGQRERVLVAEHEDEVVGMASHGRCGDRALGYEGEVYTLYVDPAAYGCGVGRSLLGAVREAETARGARSLLVWVLAANPARFFYEAQGARLIATREARMSGMPVPMAAYGWRDLGRRTRPRRPGA
ncbi:MAG: GNAT family N-acetyltransferase [Alphaproteobacteria bacterium]|nr:GNAT family N-acetyltransferase [Alphaproteobacteria bacterium]